jgi:hypothetical protein
LPDVGRCRKANVMSGMKNYRELDAWKLAMTLVETTFDYSDASGVKAQISRRRPPPPPGVSLFVLLPASGLLA